jgi:hypothetical protein
VVRHSINIALGSGWLRGGHSRLVLRGSLLGRFRSRLLAGAVAGRGEVIGNEQEQYGARAEHGRARKTLEQGGAKQNADAGEEREHELGAEAELDCYNADKDNEPNRGAVLDIFGPNRHFAPPDQFP